MAPLASYPGIFHVAFVLRDLACHPCVDRSSSRLILRLRTAKDAGAAKDTQKQSRRRSAGSSSGQLRAQAESSSQYPGTEDHDKQDLERPIDSGYSAGFSSDRGSKGLCRHWAADTRLATTAEDTCAPSSGRCRAALD